MLVECEQLARGVGSELGHEEAQGRPVALEGAVGDVLGSDALGQQLGTAGISQTRGGEGSADIRGERTTQSCQTCPQSAVQLNSAHLPRLPDSQSVWLCEEVSHELIVAAKFLPHHMLRLLALREADEVHRHHLCTGQV